jgi:acyl carrier protein
MDKLEKELKELIIQSLRLEDITVEDIDSNEVLFGAGLGLDSIDALELGVALRKKYGTKISVVDANTKAHFSTVANLARFISSQSEQA